MIQSCLSELCILGLKLELIVTAGFCRFTFSWIITPSNYAVACWKNPRGKCEETCTPTTYSNLYIEKDGRLRSFQPVALLFQ